MDSTRSRLNDKVGLDLGAALLGTLASFTTYVEPPWSQGGWVPLQPSVSISASGSVPVRELRRKQEAAVVARQRTTLPGRETRVQQESQRRAIEAAVKAQEEPQRNASHD